MRYVLFISFCFICMLVRANSSTGVREIVIIGPNKNISLSTLNEIREFNSIELKFDKGINAPIPVHLQTDVPVFMYFIDPSEKTLVFHQFFAFPGDSIYIKNSPTNELEIAGRYQEEYSLLKEFSQKGLSLIFGQESKCNINTPGNERLTIIDNCRTNRKSILNNYTSKVRADYFALMNKVIDLVYLDYLTSPFGKCSPVDMLKFSENNQEYIAEVSTVKDIISTVDTTYFQAVSGWLPNIINSYGRFLTRNTINDQSNFKSLFDTTCSLFTGKLKDLTLTLIMREKVNNEQINQGYMAAYKGICRSSEYVKMVNKLWIDKSEVQTNKEMLMTPLEDINGNMTTWGNILTSQFGKVVYIDFWASWCAGCKMNIPYIKILKEEFKDIEVVFISIDDDKKRWLTAYDKWGGRGLGKHFRLNPLTKLAGVLAKPSIPRHTLINPNGQIVSIDADGPSSNEIKIELLKALHKP